MADLQEQSQHGVNYLKYWVNEDPRAGSSASSTPPTPSAANTVHREAHGLVADEIYEVSEGPEPYTGARCRAAPSGAT